MHWRRPRTIVRHLPGGDFSSNVARVTGEGPFEYRGWNDDAEAWIDTGEEDPDTGEPFPTYRVSAIEVQCSSCGHWTDLSKAL